MDQPICLAELLFIPARYVVFEHSCSMYCKNNYSLLCSRYSVKMHELLCKSCLVVFMVLSFILYFNKRIFFFKLIVMYLRSEINQNLITLLI
jgi:hypothetical protein